MEFESGIDIEEATNNVRDKLDMVRNYLPDGATNPVIFKFNAEDMPIMLISVTAKESLPALEKIIDDRITTPLARVSGVGTVSANGAPKREIQIYVDPNKLEAYNLTIESISSTLMYENQMNLQLFLLLHLINLTKQLHSRDSYEKIEYQYNSFYYALFCDSLSEGAGEPTFATHP